MSPPDPAARLCVVNFSHPLNAEQIRQLSVLAGRAVGAVHDALAAIQQDQPLAPQAASLVASVPLSPLDWQQAPIVVNLPGLAPLAAVILADIHGRMGHFPTILRLRPEAQGVLTRYVVAELLDLQAYRDQARARRAP